MNKKKGKKTRCSQSIIYFTKSKKKISSMSFEIGTPVLCNGTQQASCTINTSGLITTKGFMKSQPTFTNANLINISATDDLRANYEVTWPLVGPSANQCLAIGSNGVRQEWYDLESPTTLVVRNNPALGQFPNVTAALNFVNSVANPNVMYTIWVQPGLYNIQSALTMNFPVNIIGAGMHQTILRDVQFRANNTTTTFPIPYSFQDLTFQTLSVGASVSGISLLSDSKVSLKNIGLLGSFNSFLSLGPFFNRPTYQYFIDCDRVWHQDAGASNFVSFIKSEGLPAISQNVVTSSVEVNDLIVYGRNPTNITNLMYTTTRAGGTQFAFKECYMQSSRTLFSNAIDLFASGSVLLKDSVFTGPYQYTLFVNRNSIFFANNSTLNVDQVDSFQKTVPYVVSATLTPGWNFPSFYNQSDMGTYRTLTANGNIPAFFPLQDKSETDGRKQFQFNEDFTNINFPYTDTPWQLQTNAGANVSNVISVAASSNSFRDGDIVLATTSTANSAVVLNKTTNSVTMTNSTFFRFETAVQPQSIFAAGSSPSFVIGMGDNILFNNPNVESTFSNTAIYFAMAPDFTPSANWYCYAQNSPTSISRLDSNVAISTNLTVLEFDLKRFQTNPIVDFYVNEQKVGSLNSSLPIGGGSNYIFTPVIKNIVSTSGGNVAVDYVNYWGRSNKLRRK